MSATIGLKARSEAGARSFLQTVLVIDNELYMEAQPFERPKPLAVPGGSIRSRRKNGGGEGVSLAEGTPLDPVPATEQSPPGSVPSDSPLNAKSIMDAFLKRSLICGMHKPVAGDDLVSAAIMAARRSDAVIVDWLLQGSDPTAALDIVSGILDGDRAEHGRLRLIVVYTSEAGIAGIVNDLKARLTTTSFKVDIPGRLVSRDAHIVVLNKENTKGAAETVSIDAMPDKIIEEFARLSGGILSTFAVSAIAAIRRSTHHMLAVFSKEMDGAFVAHRCALPTPEDATEFALELLGGELRSVVAMSEEATSVLSASELSGWIDSQADGEKIHGGPLWLPLNVVKGMVTGGETAIAGSKPQQNRTNTTGLSKDQQKPGQDLIIPRNVGLLFHKGAEDALRLQGHLARLAAFKIEPYGHRRPPPGWVPTLSLGTLLVRIDETDQPDPQGYLLCTQPRCDAVRITTPTRQFPFQAGKQTDKAPFHIVTAQPGSGEEADQVLVSIGSKPYDTVMIEFSPTADERVKATKTIGDFVFTDFKGCKYLWLGDFRDLNAQRAASSVAARLHEVGIDELEWVRRNNRTN